MTQALLHGDHHVHSTFSDDAVSTLQENVAAAAAAGLRTVRLVDHVRQSTTWVPEYLTAVRALRVPEGLTVLTGVEAKILDASGGLDIPELPAGIDRILIADHQFPGTDGPLGPTAVRERIAAGWAPADVLDQLVDALIRVMHRHPGNQLAHCFSILPKIGLSESELGAERIAAWAQAAADTGTLVEVNEKWTCPGPEALVALRSAGAEIVASTDAHIASDVGRYERILPLLDAREAH
ncbi:PHP domain-containing protein [Microbacterium sp. p3-SID336]|uniref:PHP domain-containing protein n=1 Tax=Microbacterium sp. p3-SID336 TaxID=2916212 RepID=UPI0021A75090|nr:PHP domain-containing protein [Microbacterium sp. p3-SID336]MCT1479739.1 PHP domain-containing protein [Microbacterium sp. p3-SID336]